jgi:hypothetical protein
MKIYYSHAKITNNTNEAKSDVSLLQSLGHDVDNPYNPKYSEFWYAQGMEFSKVLIDGNDAVAFRPLEDGRITSGVAKELRLAVELGKPILEMPRVIPFDTSKLEERAMTMDDTVEFFKTVG